MSITLRRAVAIATASLGAAGLVAGPAAAADPVVPSFARCPATAPDVVGCVVVKSTSGTIGANRHQLDVGASLTVEGGIAQDPVTNVVTFVPPASGPALTGTPVTVPGGLFGRNLPFNLNTVKATVEQVGPVSFDYTSFDLVAAVRIRFANPLLGPACAIGSAADPLTLHLTTGTTAPPAPNTPISGAFGTLSTPPGTAFAATGNVVVDNAYAVPAARNCGAVATAAVTKTINQNLGLPSPAGTNTASITDDVFVAATS